MRTVICLRFQRGPQRARIPLGNSPSVFPGAKLPLPPRRFLRPDDISSFLLASQFALNQGEAPIPRLTDHWVSKTGSQARLAGAGARPVLLLLFLLLPGRAGAGRAVHALPPAGLSSSGRNGAGRTRAPDAAVPAGPPPEARRRDDPGASERGLRLDAPDAGHGARRGERSGTATLRPGLPSPRAPAPGTPSPARACCRGGGTRPAPAAAASRLAGPEEVRLGNESKSRSGASARRRRRRWRPGPPFRLPGGAGRGGASWRGVRAVEGRGAPGSRAGSAPAVLPEVGL